MRPGHRVRARGRHQRRRHGVYPAAAVLSEADDQGERGRVEEGRGLGDGRVWRPGYGHQYPAGREQDGERGGGCGAVYGLIFCFGRFIVDHGKMYGTVLVVYLLYGRRMKKEKHGR